MLVEDRIFYFHLLVKIITSVIQYTGYKLTVIQIALVPKKIPPGLETLEVFDRITCTCNIKHTMLTVKFFPIGLSF